MAFSVEHDVLQETIGLVIVPIDSRPRLGLSELHDLLKTHLHPSKWPFMIVYMDSIPQNQAGKPLRIGLASKLGLQTFNDDIAVLDRHWEAQQEPNEIICSLAAVNMGEITQSLKAISGVQDAAVRLGGKGRRTIEAFMSGESDDLTPASISKTLSQTLPGYALPNPIRIIKSQQGLPITATGEVDFQSLLVDLESQNKPANPDEELLSKIMAQLLTIDHAVISSDSDFFLLGGSSLLLGRLAHHIRKEASVDVAISDLFANSTIKDMASLIKTNRTPPFSTQNSSQATLTESQYGNVAEKTLDEDVVSQSNIRSHGQTSPLSVIVQTIPFIFFYPLKAAWTCE